MSDSFRQRLAGNWPLLLALAVAVALRLSTLDLQSLWYDEAFTPVHTLHASLAATLKAVAHTENSPPLWYLLEWVMTRILGSGAVALRLLSALTGVACVAVGWGIGMRLSGRRAALITAAFIAVNPLFVWYSQEARAYGLYMFTAALALLCFLAAERDPTPRHLWLFALTGALALLTHYFAIFLLAPMCLWLLRSREHRRVTLPAVGAIGLIGVALLALISTQGGHGTQWIGRWALSSRLQAIPQYYLTGYSGEPLGHGIELLVALVLCAGVGYGLWRVLEPAEERSALLMAALSAAGVLTPILLVAFGADYLAPRNLVGAMVPVSALLAIVIGARRSGRAGMALAALAALAFLAVSVDVDLSPRLQRGDWRGVAKLLKDHSPRYAIATVELGSAPLEYYLPGLHNLPRSSTVTLQEIDQIGYRPLEPWAGKPPASGFRLRSRSEVNGLIVYRFVSPQPTEVSERTLREHVITAAHPEVLVPNFIK
jgi:mannosyltransferase